MFGKTQQIQEKVSSTLYDLTHLEINTIIKDEMIASKAPASPRLILHTLATKYHDKLMALGVKYKNTLQTGALSGTNLFRGEMIKLGSGYESFKELSDRAENSIRLLREYLENNHASADLINPDIMMLQRIHNISDDIRRILKVKNVDPCEGKQDSDFDDPEVVKKFRSLTAGEAEKFELNLDLRQLMVFKKANDIGTERVVLQTVIGMDGDVTTRVSKSFADQPIQLISLMHQQAIEISVDFWKSLVTVVVKLGESLVGLLNPKT